MRCPQCGAPTSVLATRAFRVVLLSRRRQCFNLHTFTTYEVWHGHVDWRRIKDLVQVISDRAKGAKTRALVAGNPDLSHRELARRAGVSEARVRNIRKTL